MLRTPSMTGTQRVSKALLCGTVKTICETQCAGTLTGKACCSAAQMVLFACGSHPMEPQAHLPKVPALAVDVDLAAINAMFLGCELAQRGLDLAHGAQHEVAHDVEAEPVYLQHPLVRPLS